MRRLNIFLMVALLASVAVNLAIRDHPAMPNREYMPEMVRTVRYNAFSGNPNFPDGKTLQPPVAGTIARGAHPLHYGATPEDAARAGEELRNPFAVPGPAAAAALERGTFVFQTFCTPCHGGSGKGDGPVAQRGYPAPPSLLAEKTVNLKDGQIFHILAYGQKNMPSYASQLSDQDRWKVILYVRTMQQSAMPAPPARGARP